MHRFNIQANVGKRTPVAVKLGSILLFSVGAGVLTNSYPPLFTVVGTALFTILSISIYTNSYFRSNTTAITPEALSAAEESKRNLLFYVFYLSFFLSITIPKAGKTVSNVPITVANLLILVSLVCWAIKFIFSEQTTFRIPLFKPIIFFILYGFGSLGIGFLNKNPDKYVILDFVAFIGFIPVYFLTCAVIRTKNQIDKILLAITLSFVLVCTYGVLQQRVGFERITIPGLTEQHGKMVYYGVGKWNVIEGGMIKVYSTFQNGNILGNHLATFIPFLGGIVFSIPSSKKKIISLGIFLLSWYVLIVTYSRGALVATISGFMLLIIVSRKFRLKAIIIILLAFILLLGLLWQYSDRPEITRYDLRRMTDDPNSFSAGRIARTEQVLAGFYELPFTKKLFGLGFGGVLISPLGWRFEYMDNLYLTLLFKMGIVGIVILLFILFRFVMLLLRFRNKLHDAKYAALLNGGIAGLAASLVHNLADTLWFFPPLSANFWFLAGITMAIGVIGAQNAATTPQTSQVTRKNETRRSK